ncbi:MAG: hypothetical protein ACREMD_16160 [Gemmatimonadota bacterium]
MRALRHRSFAIPLIVVALSVAAYLAAPTIQTWLPDRYVSKATFRVEGPDVAGLAGESVEVTARLTDRDESLLAVECEGSTAVEAHARCAAALKRYREALARAHAAASLNPKENLTREIASVDSLLVATRARLESVQRSAPRVEAEAAARSAAIQRDALQAQAEVLRDLVSSLDRRREGDRAYMDLSVYPADLRDGPVAAGVSRLVELEERRADLTATRSEVNPDVQAVDWEIDRVREELRNNLVSRQSSLRSRIGALDEEATSRTASRVSPSDPAQAARFEQEIERLEARKRTLAGQMDQLAEAPSDVIPPRVVVVSSPTLPSVPSSRSRVPFVLGGALLGLVIGVALTRRQLEDPPPETEPLKLATVLFVPRVLGSLPALSNPGPPFVVKLLASGEILASPHDPGSTEVTAFRRELDRLLAAVRAEKDGTGAEPLRILAVTSAAHERSRTSLACNLALASAASGARTLLVDADSPGAGLSRYLGLTEDRLLQLLWGQAAPRDVVVGLTVAGRGHLAVQFQVNRRPESEPALEDPALSTSMGQAVGDYELIVIDAPAATTIDIAVWIAHASDGVLLAVSPGSLNNLDNLGVADRLVRSGARLLGAVLTARSTV